MSAFGHLPPKRQRLTWGESKPLAILRFRLLRFSPQFVETVFHSTALSSRASSADWIASFSGFKASERSKEAMASSTRSEAA